MASVREIETAKGMLAGKTRMAAMKGAGYTARYVKSHGAAVEQRLRDEGLLPTEQEVLDLRATMERTLLGEGGEHFVAVLVNLRELAVAEDAKSVSDAVAGINAYLDRLMGKPGAHVDVTSGGEPLGKVYINWNPEDVL